MRGLPESAVVRGAAGAGKHTRGRAGKHARGRAGKHTRGRAGKHARGRAGKHARGRAGKHARGRAGKHAGEKKTRARVWTSRVLIVALRRAAVRRRGTAPQPRNARHVIRPSSVTRCTSTCPRSSRSCRPGPVSGPHTTSACPCDAPAPSRPPPPPPLRRGSAGGRP
jgi:hypothetical protein